MLNGDDWSRVRLNDVSLAQMGWTKRFCNKDLMEEDELVPTRFNTNPSSPCLVISPDKLSAQYSGEGKHGHDVGAAQADCPAPVKRLLYYFEITVKDRGQQGYVSIGFTDRQFKAGRHPGWEQNSFGYHGDDGLVYRGQGKGEQFGFPTFTTGDTVGAGINYAAQEIFFTHNGKFLGSVPKDVIVPLFPTIGLHSLNEKVEVNFGQRSFVYDIEQLVQEERDKLQSTIENVSLPLSISHRIVRSYLMHYGYQDTLKCFDTASGNTFPPVIFSPQELNNESLNEEIYALEQRKLLRKLIRSGDIDSAFSKLREWYPRLLQDNMSTICFLLHCQKFIELVAERRSEAAINYARLELQRFYGVGTLEDLLKDAVALLAYEDPKNSDLGYLLSLTQREAVADAVNAMVLSTNPALQNPERVLTSSLEKLLKQLTLCNTMRRDLNGRQGEIFNLHKLLHGAGSTGHALGKS
ncbi:ran-binding protein M homolog isoform X1 [Cryptomeria japonica]|uniref:ran-binding protein M homolog isoform X1 n=2 Tax=Cryptomeria japonica TaxID=3369 RepID=UPI0025AC5DF7|nr:ran-binding protein M homolog isoform X1 [Cryptomeria japonica]XP_057829309.1 ran-binding protein M homolog isoform X1 [Cryptomeria japonica]XP_057829318.1 ran-binding protein M homolog isoform X1 [Cryptomeria japonica]XP_057829326.1 ran-binding protein M homolog isoform X1 [Cryptomeria japonica]